MSKGSVASSFVVVKSTQEHMNASETISIYLCPFNTEQARHISQN